MDLLNRTLNQIKAVFASLTMSQRMFIGLLLVVVVGTLYGVVAFSKKAEWVEAVPQTLSADEAASIASFLRGKYEVQEQNGRIMVHAEQAYQIRGELGDAQLLPHDMTVAFTKLASENNYLQSDMDTERKWLVAKQEVLSRIIRNFPYIQEATVVISKGTAVGLGRQGEPSSATVAVRLKNGQGLTSSRVLAIVETIRGSLSGLKRENIHLTDGQRAYAAPNEDNPVPTDLIEYKRTLEDEYVRKLQVQFSHMGDVKIAVNVVPDMSARNMDVTTYDPRGVVSAPTVSTNKETNSSDGGGGGAQPGVQPNVSLGTGSGGSGAKNTASTTETVEHNDVRIPTTHEVRILPPGTEIKELTASVSMPRSYFRSIFRRDNKDEKAEPTDVQLQPVVDASFNRILPIAMSAIGAKTKDQVKLDWFDDTLPPVNDNMAEKAGSFSAGNMGSLVAQYGRQVVLGSLAVGGLLMMLMMVKKSAPTMAGAGGNTNVFLGGPGAAGKSGGAGEPGALEVDEDVIGEAGTGEAVLTGIELDDETLQSRKMVDEVSTMIKENPENAASLVKRWISKGK